MYYKIIKAKFISELEKEVDEWVQAGWIPIGKIQQFSKNGEVFYIKEIIFKQN
jgi:hypothetical protein